MSRSREPERRATASGSLGVPIRTILWFSFVFAVFIYGLVGVFVAAPGEVRLPGWVLPLVAGVFVVLALLLPGRISVGPARTEGSPSPSEIITWALDEMVAIVGLLSVFLGGGWQGMVPYLVVSLALLVLHRPRG